MSDPKPPVRLFEDEGSSSLLRDALRGARADVPAAAHADAIAAAIGKAIDGLPPPDGGSGGGDGGGGGGAPAAGGGGVSFGAAKIVAVSGLATAVAFGAVVVAQRSEPAAPTDAAAPRVSVAVTASAVPVAAEAGEPVFDVHALKSAPSEAPSVVASAPRALASASASAAPAVSETQMLKAAQDALAADPRAALATCEEHAKAYPHGLLEEEREVIAIDALLRLGQRSAAEARADRFQARHPSSAHLRRIDALLGRPGR